MKKLIILLGFVALATSCTSKTEFGPCVGIADDKDPSKTYKVSVNNVAIAVIFSEMVIPPIIVVANELMCPVGNK